MTNQKTTFYIVEDMDIQSGHNIITEGNGYGSLQEARKFSSELEAKDYVYNSYEYWDARISEVIEVSFSYEGTDYSIVIMPDESDWWTGTEQFDIHYSEEYNEVCVYPIGTTNSIHQQPIK